MSELFQTLGDKGIEEVRNGIIIIDTKKAEYRGIKVKDLGGYGRRKFENLIIMENAQKTKKPSKIIYE